MVERPAERDDSVTADTAESRLQPYQPVDCRRDPDRAAGVGTNRSEGGADRDGDARAGARATRVPAVAPRRASHGNVDAPRELVRDGLADDDRAGVAQFPHDRG